jgi:hypothetical protein
LPRFLPEAGPRERAVKNFTHLMAGNAKTSLTEIGNECFAPQHKPGKPENIEV